MDGRARRRAATAAAVVALTAWPQAATAAEVAADRRAAAPVEWVVGAHDSLADAVERALDGNDRAAVAGHLEAVAVAASSGAAAELPGLIGLAPGDAARVAGAVAEAVAAGRALPAEAQHLTSDGDDEPFPWDDDQGHARVLAGGRSYEQYSWLRRGLSTPDGGVEWTDVLQLRWVVTPGATLSRVDYQLTSPRHDTGYFGAARVQTWAFTGDAVVGEGSETSLVPGQALARWVLNDAPVHGAPLRHGTVLTSVTADGFESSTSRRTASATCRPVPDRTCTYA